MALDTKRMVSIEISQETYSRLQQSGSSAKGLARHRHR